MKLLKKLLYVLLLLVVVGAIAITCLVMYVDPNKMKPVIAQEITKHTGYQVAIEGNLHWTVYPRLGIKVRRISLTQPGQTTAFIDMQGVLVATNFMQLFDRARPLQGNVYIASMQLMNSQITKVRAGLHWQNNILSIKPFSGSLYNGSFKGEAHGTNFSAAPKWNWAVEFNNIQLKPFMQDLNQGNNRLTVSGVGAVTMQASAQGSTKEQLLNFLNGKLEFKFNNGVIEGIDLNYLVKTADAILNKQPVPMPDKDETTFDSLSGTVVIRNGLADTSNLLLLSKAFSTQGQGTLNLTTETIDYHLQISPLLSGKQSWAIPVAVTGNLENPSVKLDTSMLNVLVSKDKLDKIKGKVEKEIQRLPENADKFLKKLMGE